jgi:hypothetical protein
LGSDYSLPAWSTPGAVCAPGLKHFVDLRLLVRRQHREHLRVHALARLRELLPQFFCASCLRVSQRTRFALLRQLTKLLSLCLGALNLTLRDRSHLLSLLIGQIQLPKAARHSPHAAAAHFHLSHLAIRTSWRDAVIVWLWLLRECGAAKKDRGCDQN